MKTLRLAAALLLAATAIAHAQQNTFIIQSKGAPAGKCSYTFDKSKDGFKVFSRFQVRVAPQFHAGDAANADVTTTVTDIQQSHGYKLDANYLYAGGSIVDSTSQKNYGYSPNKQHTEMQLSAMRGGIQDPSVQLPLMPGYMVLPNYDASAIQALLYEATAHPTPDSLYFLIVPSTMHGAQSVQAQWTQQPDATGTLAGKPVTLHHFSFAFGKNIYDVYGDGTNLLMETDISGLNVSYIRTGFALDAAK